MIQSEITINPPTANIGNQGDSGIVLICSIIFKNNKYAVEGRKYGMDSIYWEVEGLGFFITSNNSPIVFSNNELNTYENIQTFNIWHKAGMGLLH